MTTLLEVGVDNIIYNTTVGVTSGSAFAVPPLAVMVSWQLVYGTAPGSITANLQASNDGTNFTTIDTTTSVVTGTVRITALAAKFIRFNISAIVGGDTEAVHVVLGSLGNIGGLLIGQGPAQITASAAVVGIPAGSVAEETLFSFTLPARTFVTTNRSLRVYVFGHTGANGNTKTIKIKFGGDTFTALGGAVNNLDWSASYHVMRRAFSTYIRCGWMNIAGVLPVSSVALLSVDETSTILITVTGQTNVATANDVTVEGVIIESLPGLPSMA